MSDLLTGWLLFLSTAKSEDNPVVIQCDSSTVVGFIAASNSFFLGHVTLEVCAENCSKGQCQHNREPYGKIVLRALLLKKPWKTIDH